MTEGELLTGDGVTQGIVRIGDTVRRPLRPFSLTVQAYLAHTDIQYSSSPRPARTSAEALPGRAAAPRGTWRNRQARCGWAATRPLQGLSLTRKAPGCGVLPAGPMSPVSGTAGIRYLLA